MRIDRGSHSGGAPLPLSQFDLLDLRFLGWGEVIPPPGCGFPPK